MKKILALALSVSTIIGSFGAMTAFAANTTDPEAKEQNVSSWSSFAATAKKVSKPASLVTLLVIVSIIEGRKVFAWRGTQIKTAAATAATAAAAAEPSVAEAATVIATGSSPSTIAAVTDAVINAVPELPTVNKLVQDSAAQ